MPLKTPSFEHYLLDQGLGFYRERLKYALAQQSFSELSEKTGIKASTLSQYNSEITHPSLPRLAAIAHECGVPLQWLLFGDAEPVKAPQGLKEVKPKEGFKYYRVSDDVMSLTVAPLSYVQYKPLRSHPKSRIFTNGLYIIHTKQGEVLRRIQWSDEDESYCVFGDNPHYPPQRMKTLQVVGKVTSLLVPI